MDLASKLPVSRQRLAQRRGSQPSEPSISRFTRRLNLGIGSTELGRNRGEGTEFDSLREYVRGDDVRSIDWRASARMPSPASIPRVAIASPHSGHE